MRSKHTDIGGKMKSFSTLQVILRNSDCGWTPQSLTYIWEYAQFNITMTASEWLSAQYLQLKTLADKGSIGEAEARNYIQNFTSGYLSEVPILENSDFRLNYQQLVDSIVENKIIGIWVINAQGRTIYCNDSALRILGVTREDASHYSYHRYIFQPHSESVLFSPLENTDLEVVEFSYLGAGGEEKHLLISESPLFSSNGDYNGCISLFSEITQRKVAERALMEVSGRYRIISEIISDYVYSLHFSPSGNLACEWMSGAFQKTTGYTVAELSAFPDGYVNIIHPEDRAEFIRAAGIPPHTSSTRQYRIICRNGDVRWIRDTVSNIPEGDTVKLLGAALDITETKSAEQFLQNERDFNALISDTIPVGVVVFDADEHVTYVNSKCEQILHKSKSKILAIVGHESSKWGFFDLNGRIISASDNPLREVFSQKQSIRAVKLSLYDRNDKPCYISVNASPVFHQGQFKGAVATFEDITREVTAEREMLRSKQLAEDSDRLKSAFLANISHEIRTPLNGIVGFSDMLQQNDLSAEQKQRYIGIIGKSSKQLIQIVNDIIDIAKLESGQFQLKESEYCINHIIDDLESYVSNELSIFEKDLKFVVRKGLNDEQSRVIVDGKKLEHVLIKLINNAVKFTKNGSVEIGYLMAGDFVQFYVRDTGIGISKDKENIVFRTFRQADERMSRDYGGNGLGLSISKGIVSLMGGSIWYESEINKGTTFYFTIPYLPVVKKVAIVQDTSSINWEGKKILIVDDDLFNLEFLREIFLCTNATILEASDGHGAVEQCVSHKDISLVLMDMRLPDISGNKTTVLIKSILKDVPVIAQTANAHADDRISCYSAGCCDFISKPYTKASLLRVACKHIL